MPIRRPVLLIVISLLATVFLFSCRSNKGETHPAWNTNLLLPLITTNLNINDIIADSLIHKNADSSINLIYKTNLYNLNLATQVVAIPDTTLIYDFKLDSLHLANHSIVDSISLGRVAKQLGDTGTLIIALNGTNQSIPALNGISTNNYSINATSFFQTASLETGTLTVALYNGFPVTLSEIIFQLTDSITKSVIALDTFLNIAPNTSQSKNINLAGKTIDGHLLAKVVHMSTLASNGKVLIDTANSIVATISVSNLTVYSATAIFPAQDIVNQSQSVSLASTNGAELKKVKFLSGTLQIILKSTIDDSIHFNYILPSATDAGGNKINITNILPPAPPGKTSSYIDNFNLAGYTFDMTGPTKDMFNTFYNQLIARIDSTGKIESISLNDSLYVSYAILNVVPSYLNGYVGHDTLNYGPVTIPFSVFKNIKGGTLALKNVNLSLTVQNGIGANGRVVVHQAQGINSLTNSKVALTGSVINKNLNITRATDNPITPTLTNITLTPSNSNVLPFIDNLPNELNYNLSVYINPNGNVSHFNDFAYYSSGLNISMNMNLPLSLIANSLELIDTVPFSLTGNSKSTNTDAIQSGVITLIANNGFPMQANVQLYFLDGSYNVIDSLLTSYASIAPGQLNNNCVVVSPTESKIPAAFNEAQLAKIKLAKYAMVKSFFTTSPNSQCSKYITIYSDYDLGIIITGQFNYYTGN
jgi:hypothetical protein